MRNRPGNHPDKKVRRRPYKRFKAVVHLVLGGVLVVAGPIILITGAAPPLLRSYFGSLASLHSDRAVEMILGWGFLIIGALLLLLNTVILRALNREEAAPDGAPPAGGSAN